MKESSGTAAGRRAGDSIHSTVLTLLTRTIDTLGERYDDETIHTARRAAKRIRAALRMMRPSLGQTAYRRENRRVRDAAKPLTVVRDSFILLHMLKSFSGQPADLKGYLRAEYGRQRVNQGWRHSVAKLSRTRRFLQSLPVCKAESAAAIAGIGRVYKRGRAAFAAAQSLEDDALHELRKQTKYLLNQMELMRSVFGVDARKLRLRAGELAKILGNDHDLAVLAAVVRRRGSGGRKLQAQIERRRRTLQRQALRIGKKLYRHGPRRLRRRLERRCESRPPKGA